MADEILFRAQICFGLDASTPYYGILRYGNESYHERNGLGDLETKFDFANESLHKEQ